MEIVTAVLLSFVLWLGLTYFMYRLFHGEER